jgi:arginyl-tRNA--protein-N-Asp/Glu arginylyltransferase
MHITRAVYSEEIWEVFKKYELAVHKKEREPDFFKRNYCNSPVYDPRYDTKFANTQSECAFDKIDSLRGNTNID